MGDTFARLRAHVPGGDDAGRMGTARDHALLLHSEITNVVTIMRQMPKWSLIPRQYAVRARRADRAGL